MRRTEPPPFATWMLEHGIPGDTEEALAGDLFEEFRSGRSEGWFWRQALAAWFVGWLKYLSSRRSLLPSNSRRSPSRAPSRSRPASSQPPSSRNITASGPPGSLQAPAELRRVSRARTHP